MAMTHKSWWLVLLFFVAELASAAPVNVLITIDEGSLLFVAGKEIAGGSTRVVAVEPGNHNVMVVKQAWGDMTISYDGQVVRQQNGKLIYVNDAISFSRNGQQLDFTFKTIVTTGKLRIRPKFETAPNDVAVNFTIEGPMNNKDVTFLKSSFTLYPTGTIGTPYSYKYQSGPPIVFNGNETELLEGIYVIKATGRHRYRGFLSGTAEWESSSGIEFSPILIERRKVKEVTISYESADSSPSCSGCN